MLNEYIFFGGRVGQVRMQGFEIALKQVASTMVNLSAGSLHIFHGNFMSGWNDSLKFCT